ncbi:response regulator [Ramlibacter sp.]|uniref:response regulator n=1 Tax=Ramlibacter sp. TaxID=1917967 RepID=UPI002FCB7089
MSGPEAPAQEPLRGPSVLLVDDELSTTEVLGLILAGEGYRVTVAADGRQALAQLDEAAPDVLVTDFMMPGMNGAELVKALRAGERFADIPVLLISGAPESALRAYEVRHDAFLRKPFSLDEFLQALQRIRAR